MNFNGWKFHDNSTISIPITCPTTRHRPQTEIKWSTDIILIININNNPFIVTLLNQFFVYTATIF